MIFKASMRRERGRRTRAFVMVVVPLLLLTGCDLRNQMAGPGGFRLTQLGPEFTLCQEMTVERFGVTAYSESEASEVWEAHGSVSISPGAVFTREVLVQDFESFVELSFPDLRPGDHVAFTLAGREEGDSSVVTFLVSKEALAGQWVTADGLVSDSPCSGPQHPSSR